MELRVFYSWQSDLEGRFTRSLIQKAIEKAIKSVNGEDKFYLEARLDKDTSGVTGTPSITQTIFSKIDKCALFIGDVSLINGKANESKKTPNPNVLIELGYAAGKIGWERVICIMNIAYGYSQDLPFDLKDRRWPFQYHCDEKTSEEQKKKIVDDLSRMIAITIQETYNSKNLKNLINEMDVWVVNRLRVMVEKATLTLEKYLKSKGQREFSLIYNMAPNEADAFIQELLPVFNFSSLTVHPDPGENVSWASSISEEVGTLGNFLMSLANRSQSGSHSLFVVIHDLKNFSQHVGNMFRNISFEDEDRAEHFNHSLGHFFKLLYLASVTSKQCTLTGFTD